MLDCSYFGNELVIYRVPVRLLAVAVDFFDDRGRVLRVPVVARVINAVGPNIRALPAKVVCDAFAVRVVDVRNMGGDIVVVADIAAGLAKKIAGESLAARHELFVDTWK